MQRRAVIGAGACVLVAGCGTLLDIQADSPPAVDSGVPGGDGGGSDGGSDGGADAADAADATPLPTACNAPVPTDPCVLAKDLVDLGSIAVGGGSVFLARHETSGAILRVPVAGGAVTQFSGSNSPAGLFTTSTDLYWVTEGDDLIAHQGFDATTSQASTNGASSTAAQIAVVGANAFWTIPAAGANAGQVRLGPAGTLSPGGPLATSQTMPTALAADAAYVYFAPKTIAGHVVRTTSGAIDMTTSTDSFNGVNAIALSGSAQSIAITSLDGVFRASTATDTSFQGPWTKVSTTTTGVGLVADGGGRLFVLTADGTLEIISSATPPVITKPPTAGCTGGRAVALDASYVYLACADSIVRLRVAN